MKPLLSLLRTFFPITSVGIPGAPVAGVFRELLTVEFSRYQYAHFSPDGFGAGLVLTAVYVCLLGVVLISTWFSVIHADLIGSLCDIGANSPDRALTLAELGFSGNLFIRHELRSGTVVASYLRCVEEEAYYRNAPATPQDGKKKTSAPANLPPYRHTFTSEHYYLPEERRIAAETRFCSKHPGTVALIAEGVGLTVAYLLLLNFLPELFSLLDGFLSWAFTK